MFPGDGLTSQLGSSIDYTNDYQALLLDKEDVAGKYICFVYTPLCPCACVALESGQSLEHDDD